MLSFYQVRTLRAKGYVSPAAANALFSRPLVAGQIHLRMVLDGRVLRGAKNHDTASQSCKGFFAGAEIGIGGVPGTDFACFEFLLPLFSKTGGEDVHGGEGRFVF